MARRAALLFVLSALLPASARAAGEPIMRLADVRPGMSCTARSVVRGTLISTFRAEVLDVVAADPGGQDARILIRVSGPAIADGGIGPGFSGSPISCPGPDGTPRVAGAISEGIGDYGNDVALATPIEQVLGQSADPPRGVRARPALLRRARPLSALTLGGFSSKLAPAIRAAARRAGRTVYLAPAAPAASRFPPPGLIPGASVAAGYSAGDLTIGAVGVVTYRDGDRLWAFGHSLDQAGLRALFLEDAWVYGVVGNPVGSEESQTYKLAAPGRARGTLSGDGPNAIAGRVGGLPHSVPVTIRVRDKDSGVVHVARSEVADETDLGRPADSYLGAVGGLGTASLALATLQGSPAEQSGRMCVRLEIRERRAPFRFCNRYAGRGVPGALGSGTVAAGASDDVGALVSLVEDAEFARLHPTRLRVEVSEERGLRLVKLVRAVASRKAVPPGGRVRVRVRLRRIRGPEAVKTISVPVPRDVQPGRRTLTLEGGATPAPSGGQGDDIFTVLFGDEQGDDQADSGPDSLAELVASVRDLVSDDGILARFSGRPPHRAPRTVYRDPRNLVTGTAKVRVRIAPRP